MEEKNIMLSVVVITYNHEKFIEQCINGILKQKTNFPIEIIIGDDCSTDNNQAIITQAVSKNVDDLKQIRLLLHDRNLSPQLPGKLNFTTCLDVAQGKYIALCEGDDYWIDPLKLQKQVDFLENNQEYSACFHPVKVWLEDKQELVEDKITRKVAQITTIDDLIAGNYIHTPSVVYRKRAYPEWFLNVSLGDYAIHCLNALDGNIYRLEEEMAVYRVHQSGVMQAHTQNSKDTYSPKALKLAEGMYEMLNHVYQHTKKNEVEQLVYGYLVLLKEGCLKNNRFQEATFYAKEILNNYARKLSFKAKISLWTTIACPTLMKMLKN